MSIPLRSDPRRAGPKTCAHYADLDR
jgi:hypothetical protein